jgi:integrase
MAIGTYRRKLKRGWRWKYKFDLDGQTYQSKYVYLTKKDAAKAERKHYDKVERSLGQNDISLKDLMVNKLDYIKLNQSKAYYQETRRYYKLLLQRVGDVPVTNVKKSDVVALLNSFSKELRKRGRSNYNVNACLRSLKALFYEAINVYDVDMKNPCVGIKFYPLDYKLKYIPSNETIEQLLIECDGEERLLIAFVLETGCRINEALRFSDKDILDDEIVLYTRKSKNSNLTSRKIPIPMCLENLRFKGRLFKRWSVYPRFLEKRVYKLDQEPWGFHNLRHRFASRLSKKNTPIYRIMELLGHSSLSTTQIYLQNIP